MEKGLAVLAILIVTSKPFSEIIVKCELIELYLTHNL